VFCSFSWSESGCGSILLVFIKWGRRQGNLSAEKGLAASPAHLDQIPTNSVSAGWWGGVGLGGKGYHVLLDNPITVRSSPFLIVATSLSQSERHIKTTGGGGGLRGLCLMEYFQRLAL
jgi:hypothetical protein